LKNLKLTHDFLTFGAIKKVFSGLIIPDSPEIELDSKLLAPDNDWLHDQEEKLPALEFINRYYNTFHDINIMGQKLKVKENLLQTAMGKELSIMDKSLNGNKPF